MHTVSGSDITHSPTPLKCYAILILLPNQRLLSTSKACCCSAHVAHTWLALFSHNNYWRKWKKTLIFRHQLRVVLLKQCLSCKWTTSSTTFGQKAPNKKKKWGIICVCYVFTSELVTTWVPSLFALCYAPKYPIHPLSSVTEANMSTSRTTMSGS